MVPTYTFPAFPFPFSEAAVSSTLLGHYIPSELEMIVGEKFAS